MAEEGRWGERWVEGEVGRAGGMKKRLAGGSNGTREGMWVGVEMGERLNEVLGGRGGMAIHWWERWDGYSLVGAVG